VEAVGSWLENVMSTLWEYLPMVVEYAVLVVVALTIEKLATKKVRRAVEQLKLPPDAGNAIILTIRVSVLVAACIVALSIGGIPSSWLVGLSALGGTAIGFASTRTIGNLVSGIYIMVSRPFRIGDYVRIGNVEGEVLEISMNYTKLKAPDGSVLLLSNQKVLESNVMNFSAQVNGKKLIRYSFSMGFDHSVPSDRLEEAIREALEEWKAKLPMGPDFFLARCDRLSREYVLTFCVEDVSELWPTRDGIMRSVLKAWEALKEAT